MKVGTARQGRGPDNWTFPGPGDQPRRREYDSDHDGRIEKAEVLLVEGAPLPAPVTDEEKAQREKGLVQHKGRWIPIAEREKAIRKEMDARRKAIDEHRKHAEWRNRYQFKTRNFEFESTQPPWQNDEYSEALEAYFKEFAKVWKISVPPAASSTPSPPSQRANA